MWQAQSWPARPRTRLLCVTPPSEEPVSVIEMRQHLEIDDDNERPDTAIENAIKAARVQAENITQRVFITSTWRIGLDVFPTCEIGIPIAPVQSIASITYVDSNGATQTLDPGQYVADLFGFEPLVGLSYGAAWPGTRFGANGVTVEFIAGYGRSYDVPEPIRSWIRLRAADLFRNRESVVTYRGTVQALEYVDCLLDPYRNLGI